MYFVFLGYTIQTTQRLYFSIENKRKLWVLPFQVEVMKGQSKIPNGGGGGARALKPISVIV